MPRPRRAERIRELLRALGRRPVALVAATGLVAGLTTGSDHVFLATLVGGGIPLVVQTLRGMVRGRFAADIVAMLAIITAFVLGQYFAGAVIVLMQSGGEALEAYAMRRASQSLEALLARAPKRAHRLGAGSGDIEDVPVEKVAAGDMLVIKPGDLIPVDAEVTAGSSTIDQAALTGEPLPIRAAPGAVLMSGSINL